MLWNVYLVYFLWRKFGYFEVLYRFCWVPKLWPITVKEYFVTLFALSWNIANNTTIDLEINQFKQPFFQKTVELCCIFFLKDRTATCNRVRCWWLQILTKLHTFSGWLPTTTGCEPSMRRIFVGKFHKTTSDHKTHYKTHFHRLKKEYSIPKNGS